MLATQSAFPLGSLTEKLGTAPRPPPPRQRLPKDLVLMLLSAFPTPHPQPFPPEATPLVLFQKSFFKVQNLSI